jgi:uncharacterized protein YjbI with pentapeptide repeats
MALVNFTNLDFDQIKITIREYLRSNSNFTDYDFEGSNLSAIIDVLAYNTYITSYNANMVSNEVFIDGATLRENVVSLARNIGYVPRSRRAAKVEVSFLVDLTSFTDYFPKTLTLQKGIVASPNITFQGNSFTFCSLDDTTVSVNNNIAQFNNVTLYEGQLITDTFNVDYTIPNQKFILNNVNVDTTTIKVSVTTESGIQKFTMASDLFNVNGNSKVFFIQEVEDQRYELFFGDGIFGKKLDNGSQITVSYIVTNGETGNNIYSFGYLGRLVDDQDQSVTSGISILSPSSVSYGGAEIESVSSVKKYAPRIYASQNRAVTATDYESIISSYIYPETESISVFGGEDLNPPKYGKVFISIKPFFGPFIPNSIKDNIKRELRKYSVAGIVHEILDLKYLYLETDIGVYYNSNMAPSAGFVRSSVFDNIQKYANSTELNKYGARFKYSKYQKIIDDSHESITSNITTVQMRRDLSVRLNEFADYEICFGNAFHIKNSSGYNIKSSGFKISNIGETLYLSDIPNSDGKTGSIVFFKLLSTSEPVIMRKSVGTINYEKGEIRLIPIKFVSTVKSVQEQPIIEISAIPKSNDVIGLQDLYLQLDVNNSFITPYPDVISSGADISGSSYLTTSSYNNGTLIR